MRKAVVVLLVVVLGLMWAQAVLADEISETIERAMELYLEGKHSGASSELQWAVNLIQNLQAEQLKELMPDPLPEWTAEEATASVGVMGLFGGGMSVSRTYRKEDTRESIEIQILTESPLVQSMMMFLINPGPDTKPVRIKDEKALEKFSAQRKNGELSVVLEGKTLITVKGQRITDKEILHKYMEMVDFEAVKKALAG